MEQDKKMQCEDEEMHICGVTGGNYFKVQGCGEKVPASDTTMILNTSFCIQCYEKYEEEYEEDEMPALENAN